MHVQYIVFCYSMISAPSSPELQTNEFLESLGIRSCRRHSSYQGLGTASTKSSMVALIMSHFNYSLIISSKEFRVYYVILIYQLVPCSSYS